MTKEEFFPRFYRDIYIEKIPKWNKDNIFYTLTFKNLYNKNFLTTSSRHNICDKTDQFLFKIETDVETFESIDVLDKLRQET